MRERERVEHVSPGLCRMNVGGEQVGEKERRWERKREEKRREKEGERMCCRVKHCICMYTYGCTAPGRHFIRIVASKEAKKKGTLFS